MPLNRLVAGSWIALLLLVGAGHLLHVANRPSDGTLFFPAKSRTQLLTEISTTDRFGGAKPGDLLVEVSGRRMEAESDLAEVAKEGAMSPDRAIEISVFSLDSLTITSGVISLDDLHQIEVAPLPPCVVVHEVWQGGGAERVGIEKGDLIIAYDGKQIDSFGPEPDPLQRWLLNPSLGVPSGASCDLPIRRGTIGDTIEFEIVRGTERSLAEVELSSMGLPGLLKVVAALATMLFLCAGWRTLRSPPPPGVFVAFVLWVACVVVVLLTRYEPYYGFLEVARDVLAATSFLPVVAVRVLPSRTVGLPFAASIRARERRAETPRELRRKRNQKKASAYEESTLVQRIVNACRALAKK